MASIRGRHPFSTSLSSHGIIVGFFRRDNRFAALLERYAHLSWPTLREFYAGGKVCFSLSLSLGLSSLGEWCIAHKPARNSVCIDRFESKGGGKFSSSLEFRLILWPILITGSSYNAEKKKKNRRRLPLRGWRATNVINEQRCSCTRRGLFEITWTVRGNSSRDDAREEAITLITRLSLVYIYIYICRNFVSVILQIRTCVDREWIIRDKKKNLQAAFKLFAKLLGEQQMI